MNDKLNFAKFISDELLAAYLDGNTTSEENDFIMSNIVQDNEVFDIFSIASEATEINSLIPVAETELGSIQAVNELIGYQEENVFHWSDRFDDLLHSIQESNQINYHSNSNNMSKIDGIIGENRFQQQYSDTCAIKSQHLILQDYGVDVTEDQLIAWSAEHGLYAGDGSGTQMGNIGILLAEAGIPVTQKMDANILDLANELAQGHKVIVGVDSNELWAKGHWERFMEWWKDFWGDGLDADHALVVTSIDNRNPNDIRVLLTDPGSGESKYYPLKDFMNAWQDSNCYMVSTNVSPAEFTSIQTANEQPVLHLSDIAGINYNDFQLFHDMSQALPPISTWNFTENYFNSFDSLMNAYWQYSNNLINFSNFNQFDFYHHIDPIQFTTNYADTLQFNLDQLYQNVEDPLYMQFMQKTGMGPFDMFSDPYGDMSHYFHNQMEYFNNMGNVELSDFCQQQMNFLDTCQGLQIDPLTVYNVFF